MITNFWKSVYRRDIDDSSYQNESIDIFRKDCFFNKNVCICTGNVILFLLCLITLVVLIIHLVKFHKSYHITLYAYFTFLPATVECILLCIKWLLLVKMYQLELAAYIMKIVSFMALFHLKLGLVASPSIMRGFIWPCLGLFVIWCTLIATIAIWLDFSPWVQCMIPHQLLIATAEFIYILGYILAGLFVTRQINSMPNDNEFKNKQKIHLWRIIIAYAVSSFVTLFYYSLLQSMGNEKIGCSGVFAHVPVIFLPIYVIVSITRYLIPIWIMLSVFQPTRGYLAINTSFGRYLDASEEPLCSGARPSKSEEDRENPTTERFSSSENHESSCSSVEKFCPALFSSLYWRGVVDERSGDTEDQPPDYGTFSSSYPTVSQQPKAHFETGYNKILIVNESPEENNITCSGEERA